QVIEELASDYPQVKGGTDLPTALFQIAESTGRQFVFLIDEWDAIFREAADNSLVKEQYLNLLRGLFKSPVTSRAIAVAYMTGILPIKKYGKQSALTDVLELTMVNPGNLACYVGFTEDEVKALCKEHELNYEDMKRWYDGYSFDDSGSVYNPNSVMEAISMPGFRLELSKNMILVKTLFESLSKFIASMVWVNLTQTKICDVEGNNIRKRMIKALTNAECPYII
ncbi:MAG: AAA family ATPase, partial [Lachnospiraceae bacterium]|nr:AAA family ATPase [Lachnospiraceae bacterium]